MDDPLSAIRSLAAVHTAQTDQLRQSLHDLEARLVTCLEGADVYVCSKNVVFEEGPDDDVIYGFLSFSEGTLRVAYRSRQEDWEDSLNRGDPTDQTYSLKQLDQCSFKWLVAICQDRVITSFFEDMLAKLNAKRNEAERGLTVLGRALSAPIRNAESALESAARQLGYDDVVTDWIRAQASLAIDLREAITRASSLVETVCKHILATMNVPPPSNLSIHPLVRTTLRTLDLSPESQATEDLRQIVMGVVSVAIGLGALRTHVGTAHGRGAETVEPTQTQARFAVNACGAVSTFLMETLAMRKSVDDAAT